MADLSKITTDDLQRELTRRATESSKPPPPLEHPDFTALREMVINGINEAAEEEHQDEDFEHYVYEEAVIAVYGENFFAWRNKQSW